MITLEHGEFTAIDDDAKLRTGQRAYDELGNCYIYAKGVASTIAGMWVMFDHDDTDLITELLTEAVGATGRSLGVAMAATVADKYGWYCIEGKVEAYCNASDAADAEQLCDAAVSGAIDDAGTTPIHGVHLIDTIGGAAANGTVIIDRPHTGN